MALFVFALSLRKAMQRSPLLGSGRLGSLPFALGSGRSLGTASADEQDGKHEMKRAPAAITSLSAASRCASRPPSDPSVQSPQSKSRSEMTGSPHF